MKGLNRTSEVYMECGVGAPHTIKAARGEALAEQFYTMHLCFDTASAVVSGDLLSKCATKVL